jgi:hypothetical protein
MAPIEAAQVVLVTTGVTDNRTGISCYSERYN